MAFTRTETGQKNQYRFYQQPVVWVEGVEDVVVLEKAIRDLKPKIKVAGGVENCKKLIGDIIQNRSKYVVVVDGDYDILTRKRTPHRWVVRLQRHSIENYLFEKNVLERIARSLAKDISEEIIGERFEEWETKLEEQLSNIVAFDIANRIAGAGERVLPKKIENLLSDSNNLEFRITEISKMCSRLREKLGKEHKSANKLLAGFVSLNKFSYILKGHLIFGAIRYLLKVQLGKRGVKMHLGDNELLNMLSLEMWSSPPTSQHKNLRRKLRRAVREVS